MAPCCLGKRSNIKDFTFLMIHVLHVSHPAALEGSTRYARAIVDNFFAEHTNIDVRHIEPHNNKFHNLTVESRLEIAFVGRPKGIKVPNSKLLKYEHAEGLAVVFEVQTRLIKRYIPSNSDYEVLEVERTDYVPLTGCAHRQLADIRVSYMNV